MSTNTNVAQRYKNFPYADYDLGQAVAHLSVQAQALGLQVRQIGGLGDHTGLDPQVLERESEPRIRKPLTDLVID